MTDAELIVPCFSVCCDCRVIAFCLLSSSLVVVVVVFAAAVVAAVVSVADPVRRRQPLLPSLARSCDP